MATTDRPTTPRRPQGPSLNRRVANLETDNDEIRDILLGVCQASEQNRYQLGELQRKNGGMTPAITRLFSRSKQLERKLTNLIDRFEAMANGGASNETLEATFNEGIARIGTDFQCLRRDVSTQLAQLSDHIDQVELVAEDAHSRIDGLGIHVSESLNILFIVALAAVFGLVSWLVLAAWFEPWQVYGTSTKVIWVGVFAITGGLVGWALGPRTIALIVPDRAQDVGPLNADQAQDLPAPPVADDAEPTRVQPVPVNN